MSNENTSISAEADVGEHEHDTRSATPNSQRAGGENEASDSTVPSEALLQQPQETSPTRSTRASEPPSVATTYRTTQQHKKNHNHKTMRPSFLSRRKLVKLGAIAVEPTRSPNATNNNSNRTTEVLVDEPTGPCVVRLNSDKTTALAKTGLFPAPLASPRRFFRSSITSATTLVTEPPQSVTTTLTGITKLTVNKPSIGPYSSASTKVSLFQATPSKRPSERSIHGSSTDDDKDDPAQNQE